MNYSLYRLFRGTAYTGRVHKFLNGRRSEGGEGVIAIQSSLSSRIREGNDDPRALFDFDIKLCNLPYPGLVCTIPDKISNRHESFPLECKLSTFESVASPKILFQL